MARKKRRLPEQFQATQTEAETKKVAYRDDFQSTVGKKVEHFGRSFEGKGRNILYGVAAIAVLAVLIGIFYAWNKRSTAQAQAALGRAIETSNAQVTTSPMPGSFGKSFGTEKERAQAAINEFQTVADKYDGAVEEKARYFIAVNKLSLDRAAAIQELEELSKNTNETGTLSKFALAQAKASDNKLDEAAALYQQLLAMDNPILAKETINFELANIYEKQGKKDDAVNIYYEIAKIGSTAVDAEGKPVPMTQTAQNSKKKLEELNPAKAAEIKEPESNVKTLTY